jgi:hypothetical protein
MHKIPESFAEHAESYFDYQLLAESTILALVGAAKSQQETPKNLILQGIEVLEDYKDGDLFYAAKDEEIDAKPSKDLMQLIKLLKQALTVKADGSAAKINISENAAFGQFVNLKVPGGRDRYSSMRLPKLLAEFENADALQSEILNLWQERNELDKSKNYAFTEKELSSVLRWHLRGLTIKAAIRKVRVDLEVAQNCYSA